MYSYLYILPDRPGLTRSHYYRGGTMPPIDCRIIHYNRTSQILAPTAIAYQTLQKLETQRSQIESKLLE